MGHLVLVTYATGQRCNIGSSNDASTYAIVDKYLTGNSNNTIRAKSVKYTSKTKNNNVLVDGNQVTDQ